MQEQRLIRGDARSEVPAEKPAGWVDKLGRARRQGPSQSARTYPYSGASTLAVHAGSAADTRTGAVGTPIYQATTFLLGDEQYQSFDQGYARDRFIYTRYGNPSQWAVQEKLAALESAESAVVFSSGMAAISTTILGLVDIGGHIVASNELYGGTYALLNGELPSLGMSATLVDPRDLEAIEGTITPRTQLLYFEALTNPLLKVIDVPGLVDIARRHKLRVVIDATFATPIALKPLQHGVDVVVHSATKYLNGHSDLVAGVALGSRKLIDQIWGRMLAYGGCLDPHCCFLLERGLKTLALRMKAHSEGAMQVAEFLQQHPKVRCVYYPHLNSHPDHELASRLLQISGGMVTFVVEGGDEAALRLLDVMTIASQATSLGGVESLISLPFNSSHAGFTTRQRAAMGIQPGTIRLSVGIEDPEDLITSLANAIDSAVPDGGKNAQ